MKDKYNIIVISFVIIFAIIFVLVGRGYLVRFIDSSNYNNVEIESHLFSEELSDFTACVEESLPSDVVLAMAKVDQEDKQINIYFENVDSIEKANTVLNVIFEFLSQNSDCIICDYRTCISMYMEHTYEGDPVMIVDNYRYGEDMWGTVIDSDSFIRPDNGGTVVDDIRVVTSADVMITDEQANWLRLTYPYADIQ